jgi:uncharacterized pyridoxal phosphate-containing UPF0001 family protein
MSSFASSIAEVRRRIEAAAHRVGRDPHSIQLVAVTKYLATAALNGLSSYSITDIGENRPGEGGERRTKVTVPFRWHMIGHLQTNKVRKLLEWADLLHSLDRPALVEEL